MVKKTAESSAYSHKKTSKKKQQLNSNLQIKFLKPRVYITDSMNFKCLVQELTGNNGGSPVSSLLRRPTQNPVPAPVMDDLEDHAWHESAPDLSFESSEASAPISFETYVSTGPCMNLQPDFNTLESWLLETTTADMRYGHRHRYDDVYVPMMAQEEDVSVYDYDLSFSSEDFSVVLLELER